VLIGKIEKKFTNFRICQKVKKKTKCIKKKNSEENEDPEGESNSSLLGPGGF
jgi:hypothetical protein